MNRIDLEANKKKNLELIIEKIGLTQVIKNFRYILDAIWSNVFSSLKFDSYSKRRIMTCPGIVSSIDTLCGIGELCKIGDYADVYLLIRKIRDNLLLDLFLFEAQKNLTQIEEDSILNVDFSDEKKIFESISIFLSLIDKKE